MQPLTFTSESLFQQSFKHFPPPSFIWHEMKMQSWRGVSGERQTEIVHNSPPRVCINPHFYYFMHRIKWILCGNAMRETAKKNTCLASFCSVLFCSSRRMAVIFLKWHGIRQNFYKLHYTSFTSSSDCFMRLLAVELLSFYHGVIPSTPIHRCMNQCEWIEGIILSLWLFYWHCWMRPKNSSEKRRWSKKLEHWELLSYCVSCTTLRLWLTIESLKAQQRSQLCYLNCR